MLLAEGGSDKKTFARGSFSALPEASGIQNKAILNCQEQGSDTYYNEWCTQCGGHYTVCHICQCALKTSANQNSARTPGAFLITLKSIQVDHCSFGQQRLSIPEMTKYTLD